MLPRFTVATLQTTNGPVAAIGVGAQYYPLREIRPSLVGVATKKIFDDWSESYPLLQQIASEIISGAYSDLAKSEEGLLTPVLYPNKLICVGANYSGHLVEMGFAVKKYVPLPFFYRPPSTCLVGPGKTVRIPKATQQFDWECEIAVTMGKRLRDATRGEAAEAIAGYSIGLDLSCRDLFKAEGNLPADLARGKGQDTMAPCGPCIVPKEFMPDLDALHIELFVNDEKMMDAYSSEMLYKMDELLSAISESVTIEPGDIIFTGSPGGSAKHYGDRWLRPGDRIRAQIDGLDPLHVQIQTD